MDAFGLCGWLLGFLPLSFGFVAARFCPVGLLLDCCLMVWFLVVPLVLYWCSAGLVLCLVWYFHGGL